MSRRDSHPHRLRTGRVRVLAVLGLLAPFYPIPGKAQTVRTAGIHAGRIRSELLLDGPDRTGPANGVGVGVGVQVQTPLPFLSILAELGYVQRGTLVWADGQDPPSGPPARARSHYLSVPILARAAVSFRGTSLYALLGPTMDQLLETECTADLCQVLFDERPSILSVTAGSGVTLAYWRRFQGDLEVRLTEGLTAAYRMAHSGVRYRSWVFLVRGRFPF